MRTSLLGSHYHDVAGVRGGKLVNVEFCIKFGSYTKWRQDGKVWSWSWKRRASGARVQYSVNDGIQCINDDNEVSDKYENVQKHFVGIMHSMQE